MMDQTTEPPSLLSLVGSYVVTRQGYDGAVIARDSGPALFQIDDGKLTVNLDGYAIVPLEDYTKHSRKIAAMQRRRARAAAEARSE
jgi:hypothetical protein